MNKQDIRNMVINLLNDEHGVNALGYNGLRDFCNDNGWQDIIVVVDAQDDRFFLHEDVAEILSQVKV